ncbi:MAG: hypothetical protein WC655_16515, partial [Candidatus Hydrogenedentales bacterium]
MKMQRAYTMVLVLLSLCAAIGKADQAAEIVPFGNVTLEMSLKPFKQVDDASIRATAAEAFRQWGPLLRHADRVSVLLWSSDGSEILDYRGSLDDPMEWAKYIGGANSKYAPGEGPESLSLHERPYLYMENPPVITYGTLRRIAEILS